MAKFCVNCGAQMEDEDRVCGQCGRPIAGAVNPAPTANVTSKIKGGNNIIKLIIAIVAAVVVLVIAVSVITSFTGYKRTINKMVKALQGNDVATLESLASSISEETYGAWFGDDLYDYYDDAVSDTLDKYEDSVGNIKKISYEITDETELSDRRLRELEDNLVDSYNMDTSDIKKVVKVDLKVTVKGTKKSSTYNVNKLFVIKESGGWKIYYGSLNY